MELLEFLSKLIEQPLLIILLVFMFIMIIGLMLTIRAQTNLYATAPAKLTEAIGDAVEKVVGIYQKMLDESQEQIKSLREEITQIRTQYASDDATSKAKILELERKLDEMQKQNDEMRAQHERELN